MCIHIAANSRVLELAHAVCRIAVICSYAARSVSALAAAHYPMYTRVAYVPPRSTCIKTIRSGVRMQFEHGCRFASSGASADVGQSLNAENESTSDREPCKLTGFSTFLDFLQLPRELRLRAIFTCSSSILPFASVSAHLPSTVLHIRHFSTNEKKV